MATRDHLPVQPTRALGTLDWQTPPSLPQRIKRAAGVPLTLAAVVFLSVVIVAIVTVWLRPHTLSEPAASDSELHTIASNVDLSRGLSSSLPPEMIAESLLLTDAKHSPSSSDESEMLFVHVVGEVAAPDVYELPLGARVSDAVAAAGGPTADAVLAGINLARVLVDGEQVFVPDLETTLPLAAVTPSARDAGSVPLNLNTADADALESLPGVGPALAARIIDWRMTHGGFASIEQLMDVSGIGQKTFDRLSPMVSV